MMSDGCGRNSTGSFASLSPDGSWQKTSEGYCQQRMDGSLEEYSETWPAAGMMQNGRCYRRPRLVHHIGETACSLWPTPNATDGNKAPKYFASGSPSLPYAVKLAEAGHYPTPTANRWDGLQSHGKNVISGQLNPTWVEWLMGFPAGWTDCDVSEMPSYHRSQNGSVGGCWRR